MTVYTPSFVAANSTTAVPNFTNRQNTMGIFSNAAYPVAASTVSAASFNTPMASLDMEASITLGALIGSGTDISRIILGANTAGESVYAQITTTGYTIFSTTNWITLGAVSRATVGSAFYVVGTVFTLRRVGTVYTLYKDGVTTGVTWNDSGGIVPRDSAHNLVAMGGNNGAGGSNTRTLSAFSAADTGSGSTTNFFRMF